MSKNYESTEIREASKLDFVDALIITGDRRASIRNQSQGEQVVQPSECVGLTYPKGLVTDPSLEQHPFGLLHMGSE